jgi:CubicO group peptidase (beta-lactamase class C family)
MKRRHALASLLAGICAPSGLRGAADDALDTASRLIQQQVDAGLLQAATLHVRRGGRVQQKAFGLAKTDSMFLLGSITKPLTATAVMLLVERGELKLDDRVVKYLPEFAEGMRQEVTLRHLLNHTSGLPDQLPDNDALRARHAPLAEFVKGAVRTPLLFRPGTKYHYQSMGILLAAEIVERISQARLPDFLAAEVFRPLGMQRSVLGVGSFGKSDLVSMQTEHAAPEAGAGRPGARDWDWNSDYWRNLAAPWGGAHASAEDVATYLHSFVEPDGTVLRPETAALMIRNHTPGLAASRGLGFMVGPTGFASHCSAQTFGHSGSTGTLAWADPVSKLSFVLLTSLPKNVSGELLLKPVAESIST